MSFGWSAGDIIAALQLLNKIRVALKDTGGASRDYQDVSSFLSVLTVTLQHLKALQSAPLDPDLSQNLAQLCKQVESPLKSFCEEIQTNFERDLGAGSTRLKLLTAGRKLQWALSTSKKVKGLREKIGGPISAIGIVLSQQVVQTTLQMPFEIQARIAHAIDTAADTKIRPLTLAVQKEVEELSIAQKTSSVILEEMIKDQGKSTTSEIQKYGQEAILKLKPQLDALSQSQNSCSENIIKIEGQIQAAPNDTHHSMREALVASTTSNDMITALSTTQIKSTDLVLRTIRENNWKMEAKIEEISKEQTSSLLRKLDHVNSLAGAVDNCMVDLSIAQNSIVKKRSSSEAQKAIQNIQRGVWLLLSSLHVLIRELIYLLAPYLILLYRTSIQPLLLCGDHFLFEDGIGRRKWLPCVQFQHWDNFYKLLIDTFQGEVGLTRILNGQFMVLNGFNEVPIARKGWRAGIQPKSRVSMAFMLEAEVIRKGRCASPSCPGQVDFGLDGVSQICPVCGKHLSTLKDNPIESEEYASETAFNFDFGSDIHIPVLETKRVSKEKSKITLPKSPKSKLPSSFVNQEIAAFKRVIWQASDKSNDQKVYSLGGDLGIVPVSHQKAPSQYQGPRRAHNVPPRTPKISQTTKLHTPKLFMDIPKLDTEMELRKARKQVFSEAIQQSSKTGASYGGVHRHIPWRRQLKSRTPIIQPRIRPSEIPRSPPARDVKER